MLRKGGEEVKRYGYWALALVLLVLFGCSRKTASGDIEMISDTSVEMMYSWFDGERHYTAQLTEPGAIAVEVRTTGGTLTLEIREKGKEPIYSGNIDTDFSFVINAQPGTYQITAAGKDHAGSYSLDWSEKERE